MEWKETRRTGWTFKTQVYPLDPHHIFIDAYPNKRNSFKRSRNKKKENIRWLVSVHKGSGPVVGFRNFFLLYGRKFKRFLDICKQKTCRETRNRNKKGTWKWPKKRVSWRIFHWTLYIFVIFFFFIHGPLIEMHENVYTKLSRKFVLFRMLLRFSFGFDKVWFWSLSVYLPLVQHSSIRQGRGREDN